MVKDGYISDLKRRLSEHKSDISISTKHRRPVKLDIMRYAIQK